MRKRLKTIFFLAVMVSAVWLGGIAADSSRLTQDIIRLHVVANSDTQADQQVKLQVRDAVISTLRQGMEDIQDVDQALKYIQTMLPKLTQAANRVLEQSGFVERATITLDLEEFPLREYDTFSLPSGLYQSLRVVIGEGKGHNWWCVVFPDLCLPATSEEFSQTANMEQMPQRLSGALTGDYEIRFWILDQWGKIRNSLHRDSE